MHETLLFITILPFQFKYWCVITLQLSPLISKVASRGLSVFGCSTAVTVPCSACLLSIMRMINEFNHKQHRYLYGELHMCNTHPSDICGYLNNGAIATDIYSWRYKPLSLSVTYSRKKGPKHALWWKHCCFACLNFARKRKERLSPLLTPTYSNVLLQVFCATARLYDSTYNLTLWQMKAYLETICDFRFCLILVYVHVVILIVSFEMWEC